MPTASAVIRRARAARRRAASRLAGPRARDPWKRQRQELPAHLWKAWLEDEEYFANLRRFGGSDTSAERPFFLRELLKLVDSIDGDTAEAGVYRGASSWFICEARKPKTGRHWAFDSFEGVSQPGAEDGSYWQAGDLTAAEAAARRVLEPYDSRVLRGWIPDVFSEAQIERLAFCHVDVDLYEPTLASLEFFYPRMVTGAVLVCDDYGFVICPGAKQALDEFMSARPEPVLHCPTGQGIVIKQ